MNRPKIIFLATEDWFVASHFHPLLKRAVSEGFEVIVAARNSGALDGDPAVRVVAMPFARRALAPGDVWGEARAVHALLRSERAQIVHAIALKPIALTLLVGAARATPSVLALTGRGFLEARGGWRRLVLEALADRMRWAIGRGSAVLLTENLADQQWVQAGAADLVSRMLIMPGAGVDPDMFTSEAEPDGAIVIGLAARLVRSKGIDIAVAAVQRLRKQGCDVTLRVAGDVDHDNPERVTDRELNAWSAMPGIELVGRITDINAFWSNVHIACLPSRGGEGLPRSLLEAAACGRPLVTTDVPGCADFVVAGETGLVVPPNDVTALAAALRALISDKTSRLRFGAAAQNRVQQSYTTKHAGDVASLAWRLAMGPRLSA